MKLAAAVENELSTSFGKVTAEWVDCPDLTQEPFNLAAPGLGGDTAILDIGGISNVYPEHIESKIYHFENIFKHLNCNQNDIFIIGGGLSRRLSDNHLGNLIMNATFSPTENRMVKNKTLFAFVDEARNNDVKFTLEMLTNPLPKCHMYGNFFVNQGLREQVLKVEAKERYGRDFIDALQHAFSRIYPDKHYLELTGCGGVFMVKNARVVHHVMQNNWCSLFYNKLTIEKESLRYWSVKTPVIALTTFLNTDRHTVIRNSKFEDLFLTRFQVHSYSNNCGGYYHKAEDDEKAIEYLGYFSPATKLYRIDPVPMYTEMANYSYL
ncbi:ester hydrolase C11orf54 homolog [Pogonomyrmex barbatus]|uniref:Ester hydrolase C11orf54 homolog n=1 Tax=Pogonomyrmex barbatus TaxID=144034 RepID=A0A6I9W4K0_9HYME|nr:ester hydrolase C11orf54 homolog [Pogonomyrmex barbatus]